MELRRASPSGCPDGDADRVALTNFYRRASALDEPGQGDFVVTTGQFNSSRQLLLSFSTVPALCSGARRRQYLHSVEASALVGSVVARHQRRRPSRDDVKIRSTCDPDHIGHPPLWS